jgi:hypothetical protein
MIREGSALQRARPPAGVVLMQETAAARIRRLLLGR